MMMLNLGKKVTFTPCICGVVSYVPPIGNGTHQVFFLNDAHEMPLYGTPSMLSETPMYCCSWFQHLLSSRNQNTQEKCLSFL